MGSYKRNPGDLKYRRVYLFADGELPEYEPFTSEVQLVSYEDHGVVLEILKENGKSELFYDKNVKDIVYGYSFDGKEIWINALEAEQVCARLWLCREHGFQTRYKLPIRLDRSDDLVKIRVPGGTNGVILVGDKYFDKAYRLIKS